MTQETANWTSLALIFLAFVLAIVSRIFARRASKLADEAEKLSAKSIQAMEESFAARRAARARYGPDAQNRFL